MKTGFEDVSNHPNQGEKDKLGYQTKRFFVRDMRSGKWLAATKTRAPGQSKEDTWNFTYMEIE